MKRIYTTRTLLLCAILTLAGHLNAQSRRSAATTFKKGTATLNLGLGFGTNYSNDYSGTNAFGTKAALEFGIWQAGPGVVSLGAEAGATTSSSSYYTRRNFRSNTVVIAARSAWHFGWRIPGLDTYAGLSTGIGFHHYSYEDGNLYNNNDVLPIFGAFVGISYFFTPAFGVNAEAGSDITSFQGGVIFKFR